MQLHVPTPELICAFSCVSKRDNHNFTIKKKKGKKKGRRKKKKKNNHKETLDAPLPRIPLIYFSK